METTDSRAHERFSIEPDSPYSDSKEDPRKFYCEEKNESYNEPLKSPSEWHCDKGSQIIVQQPSISHEMMMPNEEISTTQGLDLTKNHTASFVESTPGHTFTVKREDSFLNADHYNHGGNTVIFRREEDFNINPISNTSLDLSTRGTINSYSKEMREHPGSRELIRSSSNRPPKNLVKKQSFCEPFDLSPYSSSSYSCTSSEAASPDSLNPATPHSL